MRTICTICARGGSKGVPGKNTKMIAGKPLIAWTVQMAKLVPEFELVAVSSDSAEILQCAQDFGADLTIARPPEMATDRAGKVESIRHACLMAEAELNGEIDILVDLDATSPLRWREDITGALDLFKIQRPTNVITGATARRSPYFNLAELQKDGSVGLAIPPEELVLRRQDAPKCYDMNGSIYIWDRRTFVANPQVFYPDTLLYEMPEDRSVDIDSPLDFDIVEMLLNRRSGMEK